MIELLPELFPLVDLGIDPGVCVLFATFTLLGRGLAWLALEA